MKNPLLILSVVALLISTGVNAQTDVNTQAGDSAQAGENAAPVSQPLEGEALEQAIAAAEEQQQQLEAIEQLRDIQQSLREKVSQRRELRLQIKRASDSASEELSASLEELNTEIELLEKTFEQIAIGGIDLSVLGVEEKKFDWREELILVVKPVLENLKGLTEKPRQIESLRRVIDEKQAGEMASLEALQSVAQLINEAQSRAVKNKLEEIQQSWQQRREDLAREIQLAQFQLASLEGKNIDWVETITTSLQNFATGRGLTLVLVVLVAVLIWVLLTSILKLFRRFSSKTKDQELKVRYRLAAYGYRLFMMLMVAVGVVMVLYFRQDLLLLAIVMIVFVGAALALKNLLPRYIAESRLLLNMGNVRERERLMYNGVPYRVLSLKMHTRLANPELSGGLRLPLSELDGLRSRAAGDDAWFPSSKGDWMLDADENPLEVLRQSPEQVTLRDLNSRLRYMPSADYYAAGFRNLTRSEYFRLTNLFGIDYIHQGLAVSDVAEKFKAGLTDYFAKQPYADSVKEVKVDFHSAGDSSLNYLLITRFKPAAARFYNRIQRDMQTAAVQVCNEQEWGIPFPQLTVHRAGDDDSA
ncbi:MAG: hypothetical protein HKN50_02570 [Gammaproteobacteria bacterium]|nr:hypothetical protein [Gammaproteobacteria bacterium]